MDEPARGAYRSDRMAVALEIKLNGRKLALGSSSQSTLLGRDFFFWLCMKDSEVAWREVG